jgi:hypothetical protein
MSLLWMIQVDCRCGGGFEDISGKAKPCLTAKLRKQPVVRWKIV